MKFSSYEERTNYLLKEERDKRAYQLRELGEKLQLEPDYVEAQIFKTIYQCSK